jgi:PAS domain S-box-containing protein
LRITHHAFLGSNVPLSQRLKSNFLYLLGGLALAWAVWQGAWLSHRLRSAYGAVDQSRRIVDNLSDLDDDLDQMDQQLAYRISSPVLFRSKFRESSSRASAALMALAPERPEDPAFHQSLAALSRGIRSSYLRPGSDPGRRARSRLQASILLERENRRLFEAVDRRVVIRDRLIQMLFLFLGGSAAVFAFSFAASRRRLATMERLQDETRWAGVAAEANILLASAGIDVEGALKAAARLTVPYLADSCTVTLVNPDGTLQTPVVSHVDPEKERSIQEVLTLHPPDRDAARGFAFTIRTGRSEFIPSVVPIASQLTGPQAVLAGLLGVRSAINVPLLHDGKVLGAVSFQYAESRRNYVPRDLVQAEEFGRRLGGTVAVALARKAQMEESARRRLEEQEALLESEERFKALSDVSSEGIVILRQGLVAEVNQTFCDLFGYSRREARGMRSVDLAAPESRELFQSLGGLPDTRPTEVHEAMARRKDGSLFMTRFVSSPTNWQGQSARVRAFSDITKFRRVEEEGRWSTLTSEAALILASSRDTEAGLKSLSRLVVPQLADWCSITLVHADGGLKQVAVSHVDPDKERWAIELQKKYPPDPQARTGVSEVIRSGQSQFVPEIVPALLQGLDAERLDLLRKLELTGAVTVPLKSGGRVLGALGLISTGQRRRFTRMDLENAEAFGRAVGSSLAVAQEREAARREDEEALRLNEERLRLMMENAHDAFISIDLDGRILSWNRRAEETFGWKRQEVLGRILAETIIPPQYREAHTQGLKHYARSGAAPVVGRRLELSGLHRDGHEFPLELAISSPVTTGGRTVFGAFLRDLTEEKRAEALQEFAEKLERTNRELLDFTSIVSHDLQEPLRKVLTFGSLLEEKSGQGLDGPGHEYLDRIKGAALRMQTLIQDLLEFSRLDSRGRTFEPVDLGQVAREVAADLEGRLRQTGGRVEIGTMCGVEADALQMRQLLQNLVGNGLKFHRPGVPPLVKVGSRQAGDFCEIMVEDNGIGFEEKYLDRIFKAFQRLHKREEFEGTGMGLAICQRIAERHGGSITASSQPGTGSVFKVTLPLTQKARMAA